MIVDAVILQIRFWFLFLHGAKPSGELYVYFLEIFYEGFALKISVFYFYSYFFIVKYGKHSSICQFSENMHCAKFISFRGSCECTYHLFYITFFVTWRMNSLVLDSFVSCPHSNCRGLELMREIVQKIRRRSPILRHETADKRRAGLIGPLH